MIREALEIVDANPPQQKKAGVPRPVLFQSKTGPVSQAGPLSLETTCRGTGVAGGLR